MATARMRSQAGEQWHVREESRYAAWAEQPSPRARAEKLPEPA